MNNCLHSVLSLLSEEAKGLFVPTSIDHCFNPPSELEFLRSWVSKNVPLLIKGGARHWPAMKKWHDSYLVSVLNNKEVTVAVTPNGYADAIASKNVDGVNQEYFVWPEERKMTISDFIHKLKGGSQILDQNVAESEGIFYLQKQNSNLTEEFPELLKDIETEIPWACKAFGSSPVSINLWIGDKRSVTSLHKDPFENIYTVVRGWKDFILLPPTDRPWLPYKSLPVATYKEINPGNFDILRKESMDDGSPDTVSWIAIDPLNPDIVTYPNYQKASPLRVRVGPGDMLYLPSLWFHHVQQSDGCIAVNHWFDMSFDVKYVYFQFLEQLSTLS